MTTNARAAEVCWDEPLGWNFPVLQVLLVHTLTGGMWTLDIVHASAGQNPKQMKVRDAVQTQLGFDPASVAVFWVQSHFSPNLACPNWTPG